MLKIEGEFIKKIYLQKVPLTPTYKVKRKVFFLLMLKKKRFKTIRDFVIYLFQFEEAERT